MYVLKHPNETKHFDDEYSPLKKKTVAITYHFKYLSTAMATAIQHQHVGDMMLHWWLCGSSKILVLIGIFILYALFLDTTCLSLYALICRDAQIYLPYTLVNHDIYISPPW